MSPDQPDVPDPDLARFAAASGPSEGQPPPPAPPPPRRPMAVPPPPVPAAGGARREGTGRRRDAVARPAPAAAPPAAPAEGVPETIGRYDVERFVGEGVTGRVYLCADSEEGGRFAVKVLHEKLARDKVAAAQFEREARAAGAQAEPGLRPVARTGKTEDGVPFAASPWIDGANLADHVRERGPLRPRRAAEIARDAARILEEVHGRGVIHGALKPQNLLLDAQRRVYLVDFGQAPDLLDERGSAARNPAPITVQNEALCFYPPERLKPMRPRPTKSGDVYGVGALLYVGLTARSPIDGTTAASIVAARTQVPPVRQIEPSVHPDIAEICMRALDQNPAERYASVGALATDLEAFLDGTVTAVGVASGQGAVRFARTLRRSPARLLGLAAALLVVALLGAGGLKLAFTKADALKAEELKKARELRKQLEKDVESVKWKSEEARREAEKLRAQLESATAGGAGATQALARLMAVGGRPELARDEAFWKSVAEADPEQVEPTLRWATLTVERLELAWGSYASVTVGDSTLRVTGDPGEARKTESARVLERLAPVNELLAKRLAELEDPAGGTPDEATGREIERVRRAQAWSSYLAGRAHFLVLADDKAENAFREAERLDPAGQWGIRAQAWRLRIPLEKAASKTAGARQIFQLIDGLAERADRAAPSFDAPVLDSWDLRLEGAMLAFQLVAALQASGRRNTPEFQTLFREAFDRSAFLLSRRPGEVIPHVLHGYLLMFADRYRDSEVDANRALLLDANNIAALRLKAGALSGQQRMAEVVQLMLSERQRRPDNQLVLAIYNRVGNGLVQSYENALTNGNLSQAWNNLEWVRQLDPSAAQTIQPKLMQACEAAIAQRPEDYTGWGVRGLARLDERDFAGARADFDKVLGLQPDDFGFRLFRARVLSNLRELEAAAADIAYVKERNLQYLQQFARSRQYESDFTKLLNDALGVVPNAGMGN